MQEVKGVTQMASGPYNVIRAIHPGTEQLVNQDGGRAQKGDEFQGRLCLPCAAPISRSEDQSCGEIQCLTTLAPRKMSLMSCGSASEVYAGVEQEWEICRAGVPDLHLISLGDAISSQSIVRALPILISGRVSGLGKRQSNIPRVLRPSTVALEFILTHASRS